MIYISKKKYHTIPFIICCIILFFLILWFVSLLDRTNKYLNENAVKSYWWGAFIDRVEGKDDKLSSLFGANNEYEFSLQKEKQQQEQENISKEIEEAQEKINNQKNLSEEEKKTLEFIIKFYTNRKERNKIEQESRERIFNLENEIKNNRIKRI